VKETILPTVTIGIPVFNEKKYIEETVNSAINQSYKNLKIIISDNCSGDGTFELINEIASKYQNISIIRHKVNIGAAGNFNHLSDIVVSDYFCWLSGHDILHKDFIKAAVNVFIENQEFSLVYPQSRQIGEHGELSNVETYSKIDTSSLDFVYGPLKVANNLKYGTPIHGLFKTSILKEYKIKPIIGPDFALLFYTSLTGKIYELPQVYHFLREFREETEIETYKRYNDFGLKSKYKNPCTEMCKEYLRYTWLSDKINLFQKIKLLFKLTVVLKRRYNWPRLRVLTYSYNLLKRIRKNLKVRINL
jgi:glycosyltransferase involved in cell wall biosynthesis